MSPRRVGVFVLLLAVPPATRASAQAASLRIEIVSAAAPVSGASVVVNGVAHQAGDAGVLLLELPPGTIEIVVVKERLAPSSVTVELRAGEARTVTIDLKLQEELEERVTVVATRTDKRIEDQAMRVEVLDREEIEEKLMMTPGDIVMMLNEMGGLRVQATSPSLGAASVRIQGMRGRYTRFLSDGLPLFGEQVGSFGLLQIPPTDLARVEVIKGVASSLYGAGAMGGVVNLVSRRPGAKREQEVLINRSSRGATDGVYWLSAPLTPALGMTLLVSGHGQEGNDVTGDGWADLPHYVRGVVRPRVVWDNHAGRSLFATAGATWEDRNGGTIAGAVLPITGAPYREALETRRVDAGAVGQTIVGGDYVVTARASLTHARQLHRFGETIEHDVHDTAFGEVAVRHATGRQTWVAGAAFERDAFRPEDVPSFAYTYLAPGVFAQDDVDVARWLSISASGRVDRHSRFGTFVSPRVSALLRANGWSSRLSFGTGFFAPTPLTEETEAAGLSRLVIPQSLKPERGRSASLDVTRVVGSVSGTVTLFASRVLDPIEVDRDAAFVLRNLSSPATNAGVELLGTWRRPPFSATATYTFVRALERPGDTEMSVPLTPRHSAGLVSMWERAGAGRFGFEWYYTGEQRLEANPFRAQGKPHMVFGALVERHVGRYRLFINGENLADVRQTDWDPLIRPARGVDGRWTVDAWAPLDGRNVNGGVRIAF
jgi:outer membrane receptor for ferrienterochelin and colicins